MLPVTSAPAAETLPSVTVSVERVDGSHAPALVTIVTFQSPSYGVWAVAGAAARAAVAMRAEARKIVRMRLWRMNRNPRFGVMTRFIQGYCVQSLLRRGNTKSSLNIKHLSRKLVPSPEQQFRGSAGGGLKIPLP
jgi:hypothetical protein